jgi:catechol 2,3-dioxygenase-like lactoylglutathione lyase family enzyme
MTIKLDHINLSVANLNESVDWYGKVFGFEMVESGTTAQGTKWGIVAFNDSMICMTEYAGRTHADKHEDKSIHQIDHFGIRVSDLNRWRKIVEENKLKIYYGGEIEYPFSISWYVHDPSGHEIEVSYSEQQALQFPNRGA